MAADHRSIWRKKRLHLSFPVVSTLALLSIVWLPFIRAAGGFYDSSSFETFSVPTTLNPYRVLGVGPHASMEDIKKAYRLKAKESHPDKNPDVDPTEASEHFRRVVDAFELLSDPRRKQGYDSLKTSSTTTNHNNNNRQRTKTKPPKQPPPKFRHGNFLQQVRIAQQRVMRFSSLEQFETVMLDSHGRFERHFLAVFVANKVIEKYVDDELLFPFPFAGVKKKNFWCEHVLQTAKIRYNAATPLTDLFQVPSVEQAKKSGRPYVVFGRKGEPPTKVKLWKSHLVWGDDHHALLEAWVLEQLTTHVTLRNHHHNPIRLFYFDGGSRVRSLEHGKLLQPNTAVTVTLHLADRIFALDANVDQFPGGLLNAEYLTRYERAASKATLLDHVVMLEDDDDATIDVTTKSCRDLSLECERWTTVRQYRCDTHPDFLHAMCAATCQVCDPNADSSWWLGRRFLYTALFMTPLSKLPAWVQLPVQSFRGLCKAFDAVIDDLDHVVLQRPSVAILFTLGGLWGGLNLVWMKNEILDNVSTTETTISLEALGEADVGLLLHLLFCTCVGIWFHQTRGFSGPTFARALQTQFFQIWRWSRDVCYGLVTIGIGVGCICRELLGWTLSAKSTEQRNQRSRVSGIAIFVLVSIASGLMSCVVLLEGRSRSKRLAFLWANRQAALALLFFYSVLLGVSLRSLLRAIGHFQWLLLQIAVNMAVVGIIQFMVSQDRLFERDLEHVLSNRLLGAIAFAIVGVLLGLIACELAAMSVDVNIPKRNNNNNNYGKFKTE